VCSYDLNAQGKFEIYLRTDLGWDRVGLQDGTIQFREELWDYAVGLFGFDVEVFDAQYFDAEPVTETRKIIQAINEELFIDELAIERNRLLILMFDFILSEQQAPEWLIKTSLIDVEHRIRELVPFQIYRQDNQEFVLDYLQEVKPYHVQVREFNLAYNGQDIYAGTMTDFDVPAYYNTELLIPQYVSPILLPYTQSTAVGTGTPNANSDTPADAQIWTETPWDAWYNNYLLNIVDVNVVDGGSGYTEPPIVGITGVCIVEPDLQAVINSAGQVTNILINDPGQGFSTDCILTFTGGNGSGARAVAVMGNNLVRSIKTTIKYDRYQYSSTIVDWEANVNYDNGTQVRYNNVVWQADSNDSTGVQSATFDPSDWLLVNSGTLSGVDRTQGYYTPGPNEIGLDLPLLIDGLDYPGVQVFGPLFSQNTGYDVGNFDINPFDNISFGPEGRPTYDPAILDAIYESAYLDPFLGTRATDVNVDGGAYIDTYSSHAPEELIPGSEFDTLDLRVYTRPGSDWANDGHGFAQNVVKSVFVSNSTEISFSGLEPDTAVITVTNQTTGDELHIGADVIVDWVNQTLTVVTGANVGDIIVVAAYEVGGGNQLLQTIYNGNDVGNSITIPVQFSQIQELVFFINGIYLPANLNDSTENYTYEASANNTTTITFLNTYTSTDYIALFVFGPTTINGSTVNYSWSTPVTQYITAPGGGIVTFDLDNSLEYTNPANMIVNVNGVRARTAAGAEYVGDGSTAYALPNRLGFSQSLIADNEVLVYINDIPQTLGVDFTVEPWDGVTVREVLFTTAPEIGDRVLLSVTTNTQCRIDSGQLVFNPTQGLIPGAGDTISVITWNDTRQQNIITQVYVGPITTGLTVTEGYDPLPRNDAFNGVLGSYDYATVTDTPGSFDYSAGITVTVNDIQLGRLVTDPDRLWVTLNGRRIFFGSDFTINGEELVLSSGILGTLDVVMITEFTESVVPEAMAFRIFQDMRRVQATYRITRDTTTALAQPLLAGDDTVYVVDADALDEPALASNIWGVLTVNGERIMYRERDTVNNTVSGLLRGTAGTAIADHANNSVVYNLGRGNLMPEQFQNYVVSNSTLANGTTTVFTAADITTTEDDAVEVYVGGTLQVAGYTITANSPVSVTFTTAPADGSEVTILIRRGVTWYALGAGTPSNGVALQDTNTQAARFLRGL
jgi:hypothetical protein